MMVYILICLSLSLSGVAGLQFFYMIYLERVDRERQKRIRDLEQHCQFLAKRLRETEAQVNEQNELLETFYEDLEDEEEEIWADVIDER
jgi:t-SNARE complex subunit (syntaxin)